MRKLFTPQRAILLGYIIIILIGTLLLSLPVASTSEKCSIIDSAFTSTSAVCVTGLIVKDTPHDFTRFGKGIILFLIQLGGLGYMTLASLLFLFIRKRLSIRQATVTSEAMGYSSGEMKQLILQAVKLTFGVELLGTVILTLHFSRLGFTLANAFFNGIFHSISGFCNAGFSLFSDSLIRFSKDPLLIFTVSGLFIIGGLGFIVVNELHWRFLPATSFWQAGKKKLTFLSLHTKLVLCATLILLCVGTIGILTMEWNGVLKNMSIGHKLSNAFFQASTPRTAGFQVVPVSKFKLGTKFFTSILMFIGASPGGTGGGVKTTTITLIFISMIAYFRGRKNISAFNRRVDRAIIDRAFMIVFISVLFLVIGIIVLTLTETGKSFINIVFEEISAFGTVGLSMGSKINPACSLSHDFTGLGKFIIILTMLIGRIGSITIGTAIIQRARPETFKLPKEDVLTG
ncbi:hypothetical protein KAW65_02620 [candidate division WOR-3 bacterium]|nr:hypothetical protein [candidate division WOR-3 bacterium]